MAATVQVAGPWRRTTSAAGRRSIAATSDEVRAVVAGGNRVEPGSQRSPSSRGAVPSPGHPSPGKTARTSGPRGSGRSDGRSKATSTLASPGTTVTWGHCRRARAATRSTHCVSGAPLPDGSTSSALSPNGRIETGSPPTPPAPPARGPVRRRSRPPEAAGNPPAAAAGAPSPRPRAPAHPDPSLRHHRQPCASSAARISRAAVTAPGVSPWTHSDRTSTAMRGPSTGVTWPPASVQGLRDHRAGVPVDGAGLAAGHQPPGAQVPAVGEPLGDDHHAPTGCDTCEAPARLGHQRDAVPEDVLGAEHRVGHDLCGHRVVDRLVVERAVGLDVGQRSPMTGGLVEPPR